MGNESGFTKEIWKTWLEPFQAVRMLIEAGLDDREQAVNWLKGNLRRGMLRCGGLHLQLLPNELVKCEMVYGTYKPDTWTHVAALPWKDDFWVSGNYEPDDPLDAIRRVSERDKFGFYLYDVRFDPELIVTFFNRAVKPPNEARPRAAHSDRTTGGRPAKPFWDQLWAAVAAQLYNGDLKPKRQADIERAMHEWLVANGHEAGETAVRAKAKLLWDAINSEVEN